jgi:hypothetical protein
MVLTSTGKVNSQGNVNKEEKTSKSNSIKELEKSATLFKVVSIALIVFATFCFATTTIAAVNQPLLAIPGIFATVTLLGLAHDSFIISSNLTEFIEDSKKVKESDNFVSRIWNSVGYANKYGRSDVSESSQKKMIEAIFVKNTWIIDPVYRLYTHLSQKRKTG